MPDQLVLAVTRNQNIKILKMCMVDLASAMQPSVQRRRQDPNDADMALHAIGRPFMQNAGMSRTCLHACGDKQTGCAAERT